MAQSRHRSGTREATWWFDIPRRQGSPYRAEIYRDADGDYRWSVDCPRCGLGTGLGHEVSAQRAETAAKRWAAGHDR